MSHGGTLQRTAKGDAWFWGLLCAGLALRLIPMLVWGTSVDECTRDECIFKKVADSVVAGNGVGLAPKGWLPAPLYPWLMAAAKQFTGDYAAVKWVQWLLTAPLLWCVYDIGNRLGARGAARWSMALVAVHPTAVFFTNTLWTETVYMVLLTGVAWSVMWAPEGRAWRGGVVGLLLGLSVLLRGVATYLAPIVMLALVWPMAGRLDLVRRIRAMRGHLLALVAAWAVVVLPYSVHASQQHGGLVVSDATLGHVAAMGNDDFAPLTFDYMNGQLTGDLFAATLRTGRRDCPRSLAAVPHDRCEVERAVAWIREHPATFVQRVPLRLAQALNPHTFLTRHVRWGFWPGLPYAVKELVIGLNVVWSLVLCIGGCVALWSPRLGRFGVLALGSWAYTLGVVACLYGISRFRLPLEPMAAIGVGVALAQPGVWMDTMRTARVRTILALVSLAVVVPCTLWFFWTGWPGLYR